jgi:UDP-N-acetylglucosamine 3-dehydrogenase
MEPIKYAVIGIGNMGKNHARSAHEMPEANLVAIADMHLTSMKDLAKSYDCQPFEDYRQMLDQLPEIAAVSVCVPTTKHLEVAGECMRRGKHVLLEKPIAATLEDGRELQRLARANGVQFMVGHIERFNPAVRKVKDLLARHEIGQVVSIIARRVGVFPPQIRDANIAVDLAIHDLDIVSYLLDEKPVEVMSDKRRNHIELREDSVEFFLRYPSASAYVQANWITPVKIRKLHITGTEGYLEMDYMSQKIQFYKSNYEKFRDATDHIEGFSDYVLKYMEPDLLEISVAKREPLKEEIRYLIDGIRSGKPINTDFAVDALAIALGA